MSTEPHSRSRQAGLALLFGRFDIVGFGGFQAQLALIEDETARKRAWLPREESFDERPRRRPAVRVRR